MITLPFTTPADIEQVVAFCMELVRSGAVFHAHEAHGEFVRLCHR